MTKIISNDKRSVTTDALETLGMIITENEKRDAIHLAVEPVVAHEKLYPGQHVGFIDDSKTLCGVCDNPLGIVDPFLSMSVFPGQKFWLIIYPRKITSLRHVWEHPDFDKSFPTSNVVNDKKIMAEEWINNFCAKNFINPKELFERTENFIASGGNDYWDQGDRFEGLFLPDVFWEYYEIITNEKVNQEYKTNFFSCTC